MLSEGSFWPRAHEDPPPPDGLSAREYTLRCLEILPPVDCDTHAIRWACGREQWEDDPVTLISGQGQLGEVP